MQQSSHRSFLAAAAFLLASSLAIAQPESPATIVPAPRTDENSRAAHAELVRKAGTGVIDIYFVGDSITRRWGALDYPELLASFRDNFFGWNAANFGWGGDRTQNILWRLDNGELPRAGPKVFVVQAGTNNLADFASADERVAAIAAGIEAIVERCRRHAPEALVVLTGAFPRRDRPEFNSSIAAINAKLAAFGARQGVRYLDISERLVDARGALSPQMSDDGLHPSLAAYQIWADALKPILVERLGAALDVDVAPAPTGNPAAR
ncbi:MAG TPA: GDSL-type esterase/lipase family protein [Gammaproteobacteria bacterium]|nr:GDSL-type esterase/lipase family protein [Gammaproteobacteria bacterium]